MTLDKLFSNIAAVQPALPGWCSLDKAMVLASLVVGSRPMITVEIGVFGGSSFLPLALAHKAVGCGVAIGVDPWDKAAAILAQTENESRVWWDKLDLDGIYKAFLLELNKADVNECVRIHRKKSAEYDAPMGVGLLHIDGAHNDEAVKDVVRFCHKVVVGGYCVMDDLNWVGGGPARAADRLVQMGYRKLYGIGSGAVFQRTR